MLYRIFDDMTQCSEQEVARLLPIASSQRREQALRYAHTFGQFCCLKSYEMLTALLASTPSFLYNEYGAPYLEIQSEYCNGCIKILMHPFLLYSYITYSLFHPTEYREIYYFSK